jgi:hypothetical protein
MPPAEDIPFALLGPKAEVPPDFWASYWGAAVLAVASLGVVALIGFRFLRRAPSARPPLAQLEAELTASETLTSVDAVARITRAFRTYLHAVDARALPSLATEELLTVTGVIPVFLPARQPLAAALRSADAAKFAGAGLEVSLLIAGVREAARRVEDARRTFARPAPPPLIVPRPTVAAPVAMATPPPLPVPPPLPRRDQA